MSQLKRFQFPEGFLFGAATAAYQIEGAVEADGRGRSIWDTFCEKPGAILDQSSGRDACRHFERWKEDLQLIQWMNLGSYRFSVAWPRVMPAGKGAVNAKGLDFYERLVDGLLARGVKPNCTLFHWDLPQPLEDIGGWINPDLGLIFADYAAAVVKRLGDRVSFYATLNEPEVVLWCGYQEGVHAPGRREDRRTLAQVAHHLMLAHGRALQAIRAYSRSAQAGIVLAPSPVWPQTDRPEDVQAAELHWEDSNDWWLRPLLEGRYPEGAWRRRGSEVPELKPGDLELISQKMDFLGINYYAPARTQAKAEPPHWQSAPMPEDAPVQSMPGWEILAPALERTLLQISRRYPRIPLYVTENGMSISEDRVEADGRCRDPRRIAYLRDHLIHALRAIQAGVDLRGYYVWSLMDNFEWARGYTQRFGLVHIDYRTYRRTPKDSAYWYRSVAAEGGFEAEEPPVSAAVSA